MDWDFEPPFCVYCLWILELASAKSICQTVLLCSFKKYCLTYFFSVFGSQKQISGGNNSKSTTRIVIYLLKSNTKFNQNWQHVYLARVSKHTTQHFADEILILAQEEEDGCRFQNSIKFTWKQGVYSCLDKMEAETSLTCRYVLKLAHVPTALSGFLFNVGHKVEWHISVV